MRRFLKGTMCLIASIASGLMAAGAYIEGAKTNDTGYAALVVVFGVITLFCFVGLICYIFDILID